MAGVDLHFEALQECRKAANDRAVDFDTLGKNYPPRTTDSLIFGRLTGSEKLARAIDDVEKEMNDEFGLASSRLGSVKSALEDVEINLHRADEPPGDRR